MRQQTHLSNQLSALDGDLKPGVDLIDAYLVLLENAYGLYKFAGDEVRRELNQAIFQHIYVGVGEMIGSAINRPLRELAAAQPGWLAIRAGSTFEEGRELAYTEGHKHRGTKKETASENDLLDLRLDS